MASQRAVLVRFDDSTPLACLLRAAASSLGALQSGRDAVYRSEDHHGVEILDEGGAGGRARCACPRERRGWPGGTI